MRVNSALRAALACLLFGFAETLQIAQLTRERDGLKRELDKAMLVIDVQKKLAALLGTLSDDKGEKP